MRPLQLLLDLTGKLEEERVPYVHWKSNARIWDALIGKDDFDLYAPSEFESKVYRILSELGFLRAISRTDEWQPDIFHYIGLDEKTRTLCHVHLHFQVWIGWDYDKCYRFNESSLLLKKRSIVDKLVAVPQPEIEYIYLVVRIYLKNDLIPWLFLGSGSKIRSLLKRFQLSEKERKELVFLRDLVDEKVLGFELRQIDSRMNPYEFCKFAEDLSNRPSIFRVWINNRFISGMVSRRHSWFKTIDNGMKRVFPDRLRFTLRLLGLKHEAEKKTLGKSGVVIGFIGSDGSGKSSNKRALADKLSEHFEVDRVHLGKPEKTLLGKLLELISKAFYLFSLKKYATQALRLAIAFDRCVARKRVNCCKDSNHIVLLDRMHLQQVSVMDGPTLPEEPGINLAQRIEKFLYSRSPLSPDLLFILDVDLSVAKKRRPNDDPVYLEKRVSAIKKLITGPVDFPFEVINSNEDFQKIKDLILDRTWKILMCKGSLNGD